MVFVVVPVQGTTKALSPIGGKFSSPQKEIALLSSCASRKALLANLFLGWSPNHLSLPDQLWMFCGICLV